MRALVFSVLAIAACGGGGSGGSTASSGGVGAPGGRDVPTFLGDSSGSASRESAGGGREQPGSDASAGSGACVACNMMYACTVTENGQTVTSNQYFSTQSAWCGSKDGGLACGGVVVDGNGVADGTWTIDADGKITICGTSGGCVATCKPAPVQPLPQPGTSG